MESIFLILIILIVGSFYFIPTFVAYSCEHKNSTAIAILNIFLGWTLVGWVVALIWAVMETKN